MKNDEYKRENYFDFFKKYMKIDFKNMPVRRARMIIEEMNKVLDERIEEEKVKNTYLMAELNNTQAELIELRKEYQTAYNRMINNVYDN